MNLKKIYKNINLKILKIHDDHLIDKLLLIRNEKYVREAMFDDNVIEKNSHFDWVKSNINKNLRIFYLVFYKEDLIGSVVLSNISYSFKSTDWAFYVTESSTKGVGAAIEFKFIEMIFNEKNFEILNCEVLNFNKSVIKLHYKFGFEIKEVKQKHIFRNNEYLDCTSLALTKNKWRSLTRPLLLNKFID